MFCDTIEGCIYAIGGVRPVRGVLVKIFENFSLVIFFMMLALKRFYIKNPKHIWVYYSRIMNICFKIIYQKRLKKKILLFFFENFFNFSPPDSLIAYTRVKPPSYIIFENQRQNVRLYYIYDRMLVGGIEIFVFNKKNL